MSSLLGQRGQLLNQIPQRSAGQSSGIAAMGNFLSPNSTHSSIDVNDRSRFRPQTYEAPTFVEISNGSFNLGSGYDYINRYPLPYTTSVYQL